MDDEFVPFPRLWGCWEASTERSRTCFVRLAVYQRRPYLSITKQQLPDRQLSRRSPQKMGRELAHFLNGGPWPEWLANFHRDTDVEAVNLDGFSIRAQGPALDRQSRVRRVIEDERPEAVVNRRQLMHCIFGVKSVQEGLDQAVVDYREWVALEDDWD